MAKRTTLESLRAQAARCTACGLYKRATQTVFGEGSADARVVLVGEQPGDSEDKAGHPFVGPAGRLLDEALEAAGIDRSKTYVTNAVKHFKWEPRGKKRIHKKPNQLELAACRPWLEAELGLTEPDVVVCLGATAAQSVIDKKFKVSVDHGKVLDTRYGKVVATIHPSAALRAPDDDARHAMKRQLIEDLKVAAKLIRS